MSLYKKILFLMIFFIGFAFSFLVDTTAASSNATSSGLNYDSNV